MPLVVVKGPRKDTDVIGTQSDALRKVFKDGMTFTLHVPIFYLTSKRTSENVEEQLALAQETSGKSERAFVNLMNLGKVNINSRCLTTLRTRGDREDPLMHSMHLRKYFSKGSETIFLASVKGEVFSFQSMNEKLFQYLNSLQGKVIDHMRRHHKILEDVGRTKVPILLLLRFNI